MTDKWDVTIEKGLNGYVITSENEDIASPFVVQIKDDTIKEEQLAFRDVMEVLRDYFAVFNDKHANDGKGQYMTIVVDDE